MSLFTRMMGEEPGDSLPIETVVGLARQVAAGRVTSKEAADRLTIPAPEKAEVNTLITKVLTPVTLPQQYEAIDRIKDYLYMAELQRQKRFTDPTAGEKDFLDEAGFWAVVDEEAGIV